MTELNRSVEYTYDSLYRLTSETITEGENGAATEYVYNALNQLVSDSKTTYEYDLNGNLIRAIGTANSALYEYNAENKLVKATVQNGVLVIEESYTYDYQGNRTSKSTHKSNGEFEYTKYLNDNSSLTNVLAEIDENGTAKCVYTIGADLVSLERDGRTSFYLYDGHGSVVGLANENGAVTDIYCYDAFGNLLKSTGSTKNCYRYCGEQFDETTGLYYLRARYMDTSTGRFISQDSYAGSINDPVSLHKYLYANANPVMYSDPSGYEACPTQESTCNIINVTNQLLSGDVSAIVGISTAVVADSLRYYADSFYTPQYISRIILIGSAIILALVCTACAVNAWLEISLEMTESIANGSDTSCSVSADYCNDAVADALPAEKEDSEENRNKIVLYHYTNESNAISIATSNVIKADYRNRVFLTYEKYSPDEVNNALYMGRKSSEYGDYVVVVIIDIQNPNLCWGSPEATQPNEIVHWGSIRNGRNDVYFYVKENDF